MGQSTELKSNATNDDLRSITSPEIINIMKTIKQIQTRMKESDVKDLEFIRIYDKLSSEFNTFFEAHTKIFIKIIKGENLTTLASVLFYKDKVLRGLITEENLSNMLAEKYLPSNLKADSDAKLKEMKANGEI